MSMNTNPKISVFLSSYNHEKFLRESIDSILNQTFTDFELVIKDDASTDSSWEIIQSYTDPRIRAVRNDTNRQRRFADFFASLNGEFIAIHNSDDVWEPTKLAKQVAYLDAHPETGAVFTRVQVIGEDSQPMTDGTHFYSRIFDQPNRSRQKWLNYFFFKGNALCHPSILIRRRCYEDCGLYRRGMAQLPDFDMWVRLCLKYDIHILEDKLVSFRILANDANASGQSTEKLIRMKFEQLQVLQNYLKITDREEFKKVFPEMTQFDVPAYFDSRYLLARIALEHKKDAPGQLFGLQVLFDLLNDPDKAGDIKKYYHFDTTRFTKLSGSLDVFSTEENRETEELRRQVEYYSHSRSWKITKPLRDLGEKFRK